MKRRSSQAGFTSLEVILGSVVLAVILGGVLMATSQMTRSAASGGTTSYLNKQGRRALERIYTDLHQSGFANIDGLEYPHLFEDGSADDDFDHHDHVSPTPTWAGPFNREIVFRLPEDADEDGVPDLDENRMASWGDPEVSYVVNAAPSGENILERRVDGVFNRILARHVDRVVFDDAITSAFAIPLNAIRVRIDLSKTDAAGLLHTHTVESVFQLRNGGIVQ